MIIAICGPSGSGKDSLIAQIIKRNEHATYLKSYTTRNQRIDDQGKYIYITNEDFKELIKKDLLLEYTYYDQAYYGTPKFNINDSMISLLDLTIDGAIKLKEHIHNIFIIYLYTDEKTLISRLRNRESNSEEQIYKRIQTTQFEYQSLNSYIQDIDCIINNTSLSIEETINRINYILDLNL